MSIDWYVIWLAACGIPVQAWIGWKIGRFIVKSGWAIGCAVSVCRWGFAVGRAHGFNRSAWVWVPRLLVTEWWAFVSSPYDSITQRHHGGVWNGIGDWSVFPKKSGCQP